MGITIKTKLNAYNIITEGQGVAIPGENGRDGKVYIPNVNEEGVLHWNIEDMEGAIPSPTNIKGSQGLPGAKGDPFTYADFTPQQLEALKGQKGDKGEQGIQGLPGRDGAEGKPGAKGDKGEPFRYEDFTPSQLIALKGDAGEKGETGSTGAKGEPFRYSDFTVEQLEALRGERGLPGADGQKGDKGDKGDAFVYEDFTTEQLAQLKGEKGDQGVPGKDGEGFNINTLYGELNTSNKTLLGGINEVNELALKSDTILKDLQISAVGLEFKWEGTRLGIKKETDTDYVYVDLKGVDFNIDTEYPTLNTKAKTLIGGINELRGESTPAEVILNAKFQNLNTNNETIVGAINEVNALAFSQPIEVVQKGNFGDLTTTSKTIVGAINEVNAKPSGGGGGTGTVDSILYTNTLEPSITNVKEALDSLILFKTREKEQFITLLNKMLEV